MLEEGSNVTTSLPRIALTMGDPAGIGPEICLRLLQDDALLAECLPLILGDAEVLQRCSQAIGVPLQADVMTLPPSTEAGWTAPFASLAKPAVIDLQQCAASEIVPGVMNASTGRASFAYIQAALDACLAGHIDAVTTGPINKEAIRAAGIMFPGHTEMFASRTSAPRSCMMQYSPEITCTFVTVHVGYAEVPELLTVERIVDVIELTVEALRRLGTNTPRLVVCGLNPHAGEHGLFGNREEERIIIPAIEVARKQGQQIEGPLPPDTAFLPDRRRVTDAFICMYHDQGHIPLKALAFDSAVNTTLGLPIIRTSVDHGTAGDIAWQGKARPDSLFAAMRLAARLSRL